MNDGGPAFPAEDRKTWFMGMSLRDYFAARVLAAFLSDHITGAFFSEQNHHNPTLTAQDMARRSYEYADAMLAERQKGKP